MKPNIDETVSGNISGEDVEVHKDIFTFKSNEQDSPKKKRIYCSRCKEGIHNTKFNEYRCKGKDCECMCRTHYEGADGKPRPRGTIDDSFKEIEERNKRFQTRTETDYLIDELNKKWSKIQKEVKNDAQS